MKECRISGFATAWRAKGAADAMHGLSEARDQSFNPGPAVTEGQIAEISFGEGRSGDFEIKSAQGWAFLCRVASARRPPDRRRAREDLRPGDGLKKKAFIGLVAGKLATKHRKRKRVAAAHKSFWAPIYWEYSATGLPRA